MKRASNGLSHYVGGKKLEFLQIARAFAALIVVVHHITGSCKFYYHRSFLGNIFEAGWNGVDFFFVLSGFIIYYIHSTDIGNPSRLKNYLRKRLLRIYPIYWLIALINLVIIYWLFNKISNPQLAAQLYNPIYIIKSLLLINQASSPFLGVAWSLCYEIFFYLVFSLGIFLGGRALLVVLFSYLILLTNTIFNIFSFPLENTLYTFLSSNYHLEFLFGVFTAFILKKWNSAQHQDSFKNSSIQFIWIIGTLLFISAWIATIVNPDLFSKSSLASRLFYGLASSIIIYGIAHLKLLNKSVTTSFFLLLGDASYSLYLIHPLVLALFFKLTAKLSRTSLGYMYFVSFMALITCIAVGIFVHKIIELKIIAFLNKISNSKNKVALG